MDTNRLTINNIDLSTSNIEEATNIAGFTVIRAPKGPVTPVRIPAGGVSKLQDIFGTATKDYPEIFEASSFLTDYDLYISAPYNEAKIPVAYVTGEGIFPAADTVVYNKSVEDLVTGASDEAIVEGLTEFAEKVYALKDTRFPKTNLGIKDAEDNSKNYPSYRLNELDKGELIIKLGVKKSYIDNLLSTSASTLSFRLQNLPKKIGENSFVDFEVTNTGDIKQGTVVIGKLVSFTAEGAILPYKLPAGSTEAAAGPDDFMYLRIIGADTSAEAITSSYIDTYLANESTRAGMISSWKSEITKDDIFGVIFPKYPSNRDLHLSFRAFNPSRGYDGNTLEGRNIIKLSVYEDGAFHNVNSPIDFEGSLVSSAKDESGASIGFNDANTSYAGQDLVCVYTLKPFTDLEEIKNTVVKAYAPITLTGGYKDITLKEDKTEFYNRGWDEADEEEYSIVDIFFDSTTGMKSAAELNAETNKFLALADVHKQAGFIYNLTVAPTEIANQPMLSYGPNYWNFCNEAVIALPNNDKINSPMTGAIAKMEARILENRFGGVAPMYLNAGSPSMGGQIAVNPLRLRYRYNKDEQTALDELNFNPIILDHTYGVMIVGQKTNKPGAITDWSYIGHVASFLNCQKEIRDNVMIPQLGKANNPYYRSLRKQQVDQILSKRITGNNRIWSDAICICDESDGCNDIFALKAKKFIIIVKVKPDTFSEYVELRFVSVDQSTNLS